MRALMMITMLGVSAAAGATVVVPTDLGELSRDAQAIARGRVVEVTARWTDDRRMIETLVMLETEAVLKGQLGDTVQFRVPGGSLGRFRNIVVGAPHFTVGQRLIVFLGARGPSLPFLMGLGQGVFRVGQNGRGEWVVASPALLPGVRPVVRGSLSLVPSPLADFEQHVRDLTLGRPQ